MNNIRATLLDDLSKEKGGEVLKQQFSLLFF